jgi:hypothetical protein
MIRRWLLACLTGLALPALLTPAAAFAAQTETRPSGASRCNRGGPPVALVDLDPLGRVVQVLRPGPALADPTLLLMRAAGLGGP